MGAREQVSVLNSTSAAMRLQKNTRSLEKYRQARLEYRKISQHKFLLEAQLASATAAAQEWDLLGQRATEPIDADGVASARKTVQLLTEAARTSAGLSVSWKTELKRFNKLRKDMEEWMKLNAESQHESAMTA